MNQFAKNYQVYLRDQKNQDPNYLYEIIKKMINFRIITKITNYQSMTNKLNSIEFFNNLNYIKHKAKNTINMVIRTGGQNTSINGQGFDLNKQNNKIFLSGLSCDILEVSSDKVICESLLLSQTL
ncbi:hypothetical protein pb186bvf_019091 [Paramecium bursaria]